MQGYGTCVCTDLCDTLIAIPSSHVGKSLDEVCHLVALAGQGLDLCELRGGLEARTSKIAIRRHVRTGENVDTIYGVDIGVPAGQTQVAQYINRNDVLVVVMAPSCRSIGPPSNLNYHIHYEGWLNSFTADLPHIKFCGKIACLQAKKGYYWFSETSYPTWLWTIEPWTILAKDPRQCDR